MIVVSLTNVLLFFFSDIVSPQLFMESDPGHNSESDDEEDESFNIYEEILNKEGHRNKSLHSRLATSSTQYSVKGWNHSNKDWNNSNKDWNNSYKDWNHNYKGWNLSANDWNVSSKVSHN